MIRWVRLVAEGLRVRLRWLRAGRGERGLDLTGGVGRGCTGGTGASAVAIRVSAGSVLCDAMSEWDGTCVRVEGPRVRVEREVVVVSHAPRTQSIQPHSNT